MSSAIIPSRDSMSPEAYLLSEQISYIGYQTMSNANFTLQIKGLSIIQVTSISNIAGLVYSIYRHKTSFSSAGLN